MRKMILAILIVLGASCPAWADIDWTSGYHQINSGDVYGNINIFNDVQLDIFGGQISELYAYDTTITNLYGGEMLILWASEDSTVNIYGGDLGYLSELSPNDDTIVNLFAYDVETLTHPDTARIYGLTGYYYSNDEQFSFGASGRTYSQINIVPEPATMLLFGFGGLLLRRRIS